MRPLNRHHWQRLNRFARLIHAAGSRDDIIDLVTGDLPRTLDARHARWAEFSANPRTQIVHTSPGFEETAHQLVTRPVLQDDHSVTLTVHHEQPFGHETRATFVALASHLELACRRHLSRPPLSPGVTLSYRERDVLPYLIDGRTNAEIAAILGISPRTIEKHVAAILEKSGVDNRCLLVGTKFVSPLGTDLFQNH